jgi:hypothetical protein
MKKMKTMRMEDDLWAFVERESKEKKISKTEVLRKLIIKNLIK